MQEQKEEKGQPLEEQSPVEEQNVTPETRLAEINDKYIRLYSEFDNFKKRSLKERVEFAKFAAEEAITAILPVLDDLERALKVGQNSSDPKFVEGIQLIHHKFLNALKQKGVEEIKAEQEDFNTDIHEAITNIPAPSEDKKGKVIECVEKGYYLNGKVIRFAKVVVGI
ncbi:MAG: nucleotide exchange factor GrpE [Bacteroidia bacterium]|nr:nucleotide exchange factor GrpE [Bacteroidia bacterium]